MQHTTRTEVAFPTPARRRVAMFDDADGEGSPNPLRPKMKLYAAGSDRQERNRPVVANSPSNLYAGSVKSARQSPRLRKIRQATDGRPFKGGSVILCQNPTEEDCSPSTIGARASSELGSRLWTWTAIRTWSGLGVALPTAMLMSICRLTTDRFSSRLSTCE